MISLADHKVAFRTEGFIASAALSCRRIGIAQGSRRVDLQVILDELQAHGVESILSIPGTKKKGRLTIEIVDDAEPRTEAEVQFIPFLVLRVRNTVWKWFRRGRSKEYEIIAHELGHIFLHDDQAKPFTQDGVQQIPYGCNEESAEWQAHRFADHLLVPVNLAQEIDDVDRIAFFCNVTDSFAMERLDAVKAIKKNLRPKTAESCSACGSDLLVIESNGKRCDWCNSTIVG